MPKQVDHRERRESIARALWLIVERHGLARASLREVAREADVSLGQLQHYFSSRAGMLAFAHEFAAEQTSQRIQQGIAALRQPPHPRDVLRLVLTELLPLRPESKATSQMSSAYVLEAMRDPELRQQVAAGLREGRAGVERLIVDAVSEGQIAPDRDPSIETDHLLALTGFAPLLALGVLTQQAALAAIEQHLDRLFGPAS